MPAVRRLIASLLLTAGCIPAAFPAGQPPARPPNFVVIVVDDLRWDDLGIAGHPFVETPAIDLAPTVLDLAGVTDAVPRQGRSLLPLLRGERPPWRSSVMIEYTSDTVFPRIRNMDYRAVRTERAKYTRCLELPGKEELYDLQADPYELDNLMGSRRERQLLPPLQAELARMQLETEDDVKAE